MTLTCADTAKYEVVDVSRILTPALAIYADLLDHNIARVLAIVGHANRWRPHVKTAKLAYTMRRLIEHGVTQMKCATTLELSTACKAGANDVVVAYPVVGPAAARVSEIANAFPSVAVSALVEDEWQVELWNGSQVGLFIDVNSGMNRTGINARRLVDIVSIARKVIAAGLHFRGIHYYDGHHNHPSLTERTLAAHAGYDQLIGIITALQDAGILVEEVITSGTPTLPCAITYSGFRTNRFLHRVSPGTVVYNDCTSLSQLPPEYDLRAAAVVIATVVSHPDESLVTCDAGHKTVALDSGVPNCCVLGMSTLQPLNPSEEHLPLRVLPYSPAPRVGERLYLVPRHVCPTVNNFDHALIIREGRVAAVEQVTARGRELPILASAASGS